MRDISAELVAELEWKGCIFKDFENIFNQKLFQIVWALSKKQSVYDGEDYRKLAQLKNSYPSSKQNQKTWLQQRNYDPQRS